MALILMVLALLAAFSSGSAEIENTCYSTAPSHLVDREYGCETNYDAIPRNNNGSLEEQGCTPVMIYYIGRHGTRQPEKDDTEGMMKYLGDIQKEVKAINGANGMCKQDVDAIKGWKLRYKLSEADLLVETGERENYDIGQRFMHRLPSLLNVTYSKETFKIRHTDDQLTKHSAKYFARGIFGHEFHDDSLDNKLEITEVVNSKDFLLRYYQLCDAWQKMFKQPIKELKAFDESAAMTKVLDNVKIKLGLTTKLDAEKVHAIFMACAYDHIIYGFPVSRDPIPRNSSGSPWCAAFTPKELKALEYRDDIFDYYYAGYGNDLNAKTTCPMTKDIVEHLKKASDGSASNVPKGVFRFSHDIFTMITMQTRLGLFKDAAPIAPLKGSGYDEAKLASRTFQSSYNVPMAANIAIIVYKCGNDYKFKLTVNEEETKFAGCSQNLCDIKVLMDDLGKTCDHDEICKVDEKPKPSAATSVGGIAYLMYIVMFGIIALMQ